MPATVLSALFLPSHFIRRTTLLPLSQMRELEIPAKEQFAQGHTANRTKNEKSRQPHARVGAPHADCLSCWWMEQWACKSVKTVSGKYNIDRRVYTQTKDVTFDRITIWISPRHVILGTRATCQQPFCGPSLKGYVSRGDKMGSFLDCHYQMSQEGGEQERGRGSRRVLRTFSFFNLLNSALTFNGNKTWQLL